MLKNVMHVNRVGFLGGVERIILTLGSGFERFGYQPAIICPAGGALQLEAEARGIPVFSANFDRMRITANPLVLGSYPAAWMRGARMLESKAVENRTRVFHLHHPVSALYAARAMRRLRAPAVLHVHEIGPPKLLYALALRRAAQLVDRFICVSEASRDLLSFLKIIPDRIDVINNGIDSSFMKQLDCVPAREVTDQGSGPHVAVFGVIEPRKGQDVFIKAASGLADLYPNARFWIVGGLSLEDKAGFHNQLIQLVEQKGLTGRVRFVGHRADVASWMRAMDVVVLPSVAHESFGMVLAEAQILGRPVVASRIGGTHEVVQDGSTGFLVNPNDEGALASAIERSFRLGPEKLKKIAAIALERFSPDSFRTKIASVYDRLTRLP